jgi:hypothetical protein
MSRPSQEKNAVFAPNSLLKPSRNIVLQVITVGMRLAVTIVALLPAPWRQNYNRKQRRHVLANDLMRIRC